MSLLGGQLAAGVQAEVDGEVRQLPSQRLHDSRQRATIAWSSSIRSAFAARSAEVDVAADRWPVLRVALADRAAEFVDLGGDALDGVRVDVAVVEGHVHARAVVPDDRRVEEVGPAERVRRDVEAVLEVPVSSPASGK
ncbi:hypothetical protein GCM10020221_26080 [Streptomyces thioluteus]|uniref:Uncharacterized protein n=1 Tax=Streptomyces thioluteus TaxID=66431 RepID=A0ABN3WVV7_STRTU